MVSIARYIRKWCFCWSCQLPKAIGLSFTYDLKCNPTSEHTRTYTHIHRVSVTQFVRRKWRSKNVLTKPGQKKHIFSFWWIMSLFISTGKVRKTRNDLNRIWNCVFCSLFVSPGLMSALYLYVRESWIMQILMKKYWLGSCELICTHVILTSTHIRGFP